MADGACQEAIVEGLDLGRLHGFRLQASHLAGLRLAMVPAA